MAKKQTRRSISVSRTTYERLKAFCEANNISMSQFVETRVGDFLGSDAAAALPRSIPGGGGGGGPRPDPTRPYGGGGSNGAGRPSIAGVDQQRAAPSRPAMPVPMTSAAARYAVDPPPPIIKPKNDQPAPAPVVKTADQIFTF